MERAETQLRQRKARDRAGVLLLAGIVLLLPPFAGLFQIDGKIFGLPVTLVYLFSVWALLILGAWRLASRLRDDDGS